MISHDNGNDEVTLDLPDVFLPYQQRLMAAIDAYPVVVVEKSRRTGYSWALGAMATLAAAAARKSGGMDVLYMGYEKDMTREFIGYVAEWAKEMGRAASDVQEFIWKDPDKPEADVLAFRITFASGFEVMALPSVARALRGKQGLVILDEAAFNDDVDGIIKAAMAHLIWGGKVVVVSTHNGDTNPFNELVNSIRAGAVPYHLQRLTFDEAVAEGLGQRVFLTLGRAWTPEAETEWADGIKALYADNVDEELNVIPNPSTGTFLPGPLIEARMVRGIDVFRWQRESDFQMWADHLRQAEADDWLREHVEPALRALDAAAPHCFGFDVARRGDVSVFWPLAIDKMLTRRTPFVIEMRNIPFAQQRQVIWYVIKRLPRLRGGWMDATGLGMQIAEETMQQFGASIVPVMLSEPWYRENMPALKQAFEDDAIVLPADREILSDMRQLKLVRGVARVPDRVRNDEGLKRHGDAAIALALAHAASRADFEVYEYEAAGRQPGPQHRYTSQPPREDDEMPPTSRGIGLARRSGAW